MSGEDAVSAGHDATGHGISGKLPGLVLGCIGVFFGDMVLIFGSSADLASAYGIAVTGDMVPMSILASVLVVKGWKWSRLMTALIIGPLLLIELVFFAVNGTKLMDGGYIPVLTAAVICLLMWALLRGSAHVAARPMS